MKIAKIRQKWQKENSRFDKDILLAHAIKKPKEFLYTNPEFRLSVSARLRLAYFLFLYKRGYCVATITGHKEFFGLYFFVNKNVLIPRPETELMVEEAAVTIISNNQYPIILIDIGTGSGCIPIAIKKTLQHKNIKTHAIDISKNALRVAKKNAKKHNVKINFHKSDLLAQYPISYILNPIVITANLPYLTAKQFAQEKSIQKEPKLALVADDKNGLALYEKLLRQIKRLLNERDSSASLGMTVLLEIDPSQTAGIYDLVNNILPTVSVVIKKDLRGQDRLAIIQLPTSTTTSEGTI